jgi:hypothetical protein
LDAELSDPPFTNLHGLTCRILRLYIRSRNSGAVMMYCTKDLRVVDKLLDLMANGSFEVKLEAMRLGIALLSGPLVVGAAVIQSALFEHVVESSLLCHCVIHALSICHSLPLEWSLAPLFVLVRPSLASPSGALVTVFGRPGRRGNGTWFVSRVRPVLTPKIRKKFNPGR